MTKTKANARTVSKRSDGHGQTKKMGQKKPLVCIKRKKP